METPGAGLVALIAGIIAGACIAAVVVLAIKEKRKTGRYPVELVGSYDHLGWFGTGWILWMFGRFNVPESWMDIMPFSIVVLGIDLALLIAFAALGGYALTHAFKPGWNRSWGPWITWALLFPALSTALLLADVKRVAGTPWVWILGVLIAIFLSPFCARWAYEEFYLRRAPQEPKTKPVKSRIIRPNEPV